jgi:tripeptide aminopeptidase
MSLLDKFIRYISIDTTSDSSKDNTPSTKSQLEFAKMLIDELNLMNVDEIFFDDKNCYVYAKLKGNEQLPKIGFVAHLDTSEQAKGNDIKPQIICNYDGNDVKLNHSQIISSEMYPDLKTHKGKTLITTDGTTLLGSDDKAGIAEIMQMLEYFSLNKEEHGDIYVCFTPDEEIGLGTQNIDYKIFKPDLAYTVDGSSLGEFSYENFNAAKVDIEINGFSTHAGSAKGKMINAIRIATIINSLLLDELPENTEGYEGFFHLTNLEGNVSHAKMKYLIRDFDKENFEKRKVILKTIIEQLNNKYNNCISYKINDQYFNMYKVINSNKDLIDNTVLAMKQVDVEPLIIPIRGGTDGTEISYNGIPCPNIGTGGHNFHSVYEYICMEDMEKTVDVLISIVKQFSKNKKLVNKRESK